MSIDDSGEVAAFAPVEPVMVPSFSVGASLREARERKGLELTNAASTLRIRLPYLTALEEGRHKDLPGGTYAIGFLRTYSEFLGLDSEEMVRRFRQEADGDIHAYTELQFPSPVSEGRMPSFSLLLLGLAAIVFAYAVWWTVDFRRESANDLVPAIPERLTSLMKRPAGLGVTEAQPAKPTDAAPGDTAAAAPATPAAPAPVEQGAPAAPAAPAPAADAAAPAAPTAAAETKDVVPPSEEDDHSGVSPTTPLPLPSVAPTPTAKPKNTPVPVGQVEGPEDARVVIRAIVDDCWIQVRESDGQLVVSRLLRRGDSYRVPNRAGLTLTAGNSGALEVSVDGKKVGPVGSSKQVKHDVALDPNKLLKN